MLYFIAIDLDEENWKVDFGNIAREFKKDIVFEKL